MTDFDREGYLDKLRELVMTGGKPFIKITLDPETGDVEISHQGLADDVDLAYVLQEIALLMADAE